MTDALIDRCKALLEPHGGRETANDWPVPIAKADLRELIRRAERDVAKEHPAAESDYFWPPEDP